MRHFQCRCGNVLFFENTRCLRCEVEVGFDPGTDSVVPVDGSALKRCENGVRYAACNWLLPAAAPDAVCISCRLNRTIPDLSDARNLVAWRKIEVAKRRTLYTLARLGLRPLPEKDDPDHGLAFDFLRSTGEQRVLTGHSEGLITLNVEEADDSERERQRELMGERWRTLIGHFRHETAHYYWDRFFKGRTDDDPFLAGCRATFGDERADYAEGLRRHYERGPESVVSGNFISSYASAHPWEDWAETWAHYLHLTDGTETARAFGFNSRAVPIPFTPFPAQVATLPGSLRWKKGEGRRFLSKLHDWAKLAPAINELGASLGHPAIYPFVFSSTTIRKLCFIHFVVLTLAPTIPSAVTLHSAESDGDGATGV